MAEQKVYDLAIIGAGPAALSAAVYTTREDIGTILLEKGAVGGLAAVTDWVDNYPGFSKGVSGLDLAQELETQAERFGAKIEYNEVTGIADDGDLKRLTTHDSDIVAKAILIATGTDYKKLGIIGEAEFYGRGVHYCATCDGAFYRDKRLVVVGGGNSGVQEALFLTRFATHIDLLVRSTVKASEVLQHDLAKNDKITVHLNTTTDEIIGGDDKKVKKVMATKNGKKIELETDGVFVFVGLRPNTAFLRGGPVKLDDMGFVMTDDGLQTSIPGVYCAGDVRSGATMQIATAVGEGAMAALKIRHFLEHHSREYATVANQAIS